MANLLSLATFMPSIGALILAIFLRGDDEFAQRNAKWVAMATTLSTFLVSLFVLFGFDPSDTDFQFVEEHEWILGFSYKLGVDGISLLFVVLTALIMPLVIGASWDVTERVKEYMIALLSVETLILGAFMALDLVLFFLFLEAAIIPMFLIIGTWGNEKRTQASLRYVMFSLVGSAFLLLAFVTLAMQAGTTDVQELGQLEMMSRSFELLGIQIEGGSQTVIWLALFLAFALKLPIWPTHTWLPEAQAQASTAGSMILGALLLNMGGYGMLRFLVTLFPSGAEALGPFVFGLSSIAILYVAVAAMAQQNMNRMFAHLSLLHMAFVMLGIFSANRQGLDGAMFMMISHTIVASALFLSVGVLHSRLQSKDIDAYGGLMKRMPVFVVIFLFFILASLGMPGTSGFVGLFLLMAGLFQISALVTALMALALIFAVAAAFALYRKVVWGDLIKESLKSIKDLTWRERTVFAPLVLSTFLLGIYPSLVTDLIGPTIGAVLDQYDLATEMSGPSSQFAQN